MAKKDQLSPIIKQVNKDVSAEILQRASALDVGARIATGITSLDKTLRGGLPLGSPILLAGFKSTGKSAFCYHMAGRVVEQTGGVVILVQTEPGFDIDWAASCGLPTGNTIFTTCEDASGEHDIGGDLSDTLDVVLKLLKEHKPACLIFDSLSALSGAMDKAVGDGKSRGGRAKPIAEFFRKLNWHMDKTSPPLLMIVEHLQPDVSSQYGRQMTTGGVVKGYIATTEIWFRRAGRVVEVVDELVDEKGKSRELPVELEVSWEIKKSKTSPEGGVGKFNLGLRDTEIIHAGEISDFEDLLAQAIMLGVVEKKGGWFSYGEEKHHGVFNFRAALTRDALQALISGAGEEAGGEDSSGDGGEEGSE